MGDGDRTGASCEPPFICGRPQFLIIVPTGQSLIQIKYAHGPASRSSGRDCLPCATWVAAISNDMAALSCSAGAGRRPGRSRPRYNKARRGDKRVWGDPVRLLFPIVVLPSGILARLRHFQGASYSDVRLHHRALLTCRRPEQRGARRPGARALARRLHHEDPCKIGRLRGHHRLRPDRRRSLRRASLRNPARYRARHSAPRRHLRQRLRQQGQTARRQERAASLPSSPTRPTKRPSQPSSHAPSTRPERASQGVGRLKRFKRVALRCEKTARNFRSIVSFAAGLCLIKFVHTA